MEIPEELYRLTDIFVPNRHAAAKLAPFPEVERQAEYFLEQGVRNVIITLGHRGCYLRTPEQAFWYDAPPVATVDATGAADAFIAALAVYLLQNYSLEDAVEIGQPCGRVLCHQTGGHPGAGGPELPGPVSGDQTETSALLPLSTSRFP